MMWFKALPGEWASEKARCSWRFPSPGPLHPPSSMLPALPSGTRASLLTSHAAPPAPLERGRKGAVPRGLLRTQPTPPGYRGPSCLYRPLQDQKEGCLEALPPATDHREGQAQEGPARPWRPALAEDSSSDRRGTQCAHPGYRDAGLFQGHTHPNNLLAALGSAHGRHSPPCPQYKQGLVSCYQWPDPGDP